MDTTTRLKYIDCLRGMAIILVILGHSIQYADETACSSNYLYRFIYSFHMPLFMFVAGLMSGAKGVINLNSIKKRAMQLLIPFFCWPITVGLTHWNSFSFQIYPQIIDKPDCGLWFLWVLFFISIIFYMCTLLSKWAKIKEIYITGIVAILLPVIYMMTRYNHYGMALISWHFLFFWIGYILNKKGNLLLHLSHKAFMYLAVFIIAFVIKCLLDDFGYTYLEQHLPSFATKIVKYIADVLVAIMGIAACYGTVRQIYESQMPIFEKLGGAEFLGQISLGIYAVQFPVVGLFLRSFSNYSLPVVILLSFWLSTIFSMCLVQGLSHSRVLSFFLLGKKKQE